MVNCKKWNGEAMSELKKGTIAMTAAYIWWGLMPFYWYILNHVPSMEITAYRVSFSFITILAILVFTKNLKVFSILKNRKKAMLIALGAVMLAVNWSLFIYAVSIGRYSEAGMGYYINPIVSILLGLVFLKEKMSKGQVAALILVTTGVIYYIISMGVVPYIALLLALTFAIYGLYKKTAGLGSVQALAVETAFLVCEACCRANGLGRKTCHPG
jgi:chloramphenicol-sensitive protein RarD